MMNDRVVSISKDCLTQIRKLEKETDLNIRDEILNVANQLMEDPTSKGLYLERMDGAKDQNIWSARVNGDYRAILNVQGDNYIILWVDHHDAAYEWAKDKIVDIDSTTRCRIDSL